MNLNDRLKAMESAKKAAHAQLTQRKAIVTMIVETVANMYDVPAASLYVPKNYGPRSAAASARVLAIALSSQFSGLNTIQVGDIFGTDHSMVTHSTRKVASAEAMTRAKDNIMSHIKGLWAEKPPVVNGK